ncbi:MAG: MCE family protein [Nitrosomonas sp.]|uniref:MlaD family protein n=1 Tax=Nitrosomonas sp. TaxID=42353 RepID=UPI0025D6F416|nr:MlaD family protein [Nitrosomonas sp.]UJP02753.1 MAG: MCE family protein [Nitrosomonas sp.]
MENRAHALVAGIFVIFLSIAIALVTVWFSGSNIQRIEYLIVTKESVSGLNPQSAVHYRGVNIGKVENIEFDPENQQQILVRISVNENVILRNSTYAQLGYQGVTGLAYIQLNDDGIGTDQLAHDARIPMRRSLLDEVTGSGQDLLTNVNQLVLKMHHLLNDENQDHVSQILQNIQKATRNFDGIAGHLQPVLTSFTELTTESATLVKRLDQLLGEVNMTVAKINQKDGIFDSLSQSTQELAMTIPELRNVSNSITRSSHNFDKVLHQLEENPQSLLFGRPSPLPGPGEAGFVPPKE